MDGLLITHGGKRYYVRPELLELCHVSDADLQELQKGKAIPKDPVVPLSVRERELSQKELSGVSGGVEAARKVIASATVMCP